MSHISGKKLKKGSILVFTLIILAMLLAIGVSIAQMAARERRAASAAGASNQSFQAADSGLEIVTQKLSGIASSAKINTIVTVGYQCNDNSGVGYFEGWLDPPTNTVKFSINFYGSGDTPLSCNDVGAMIEKVKSTGSYKGTIRAIKSSVTSLYPWCVVKAYVNPQEFGGAGSGVYKTLFEWEARNDSNGQLEIECVDSGGGLHSGDIVIRSNNNLNTTYQIPETSPAGGQSYEYTEPQTCTLTVASTSESQTCWTDVVMPNATIFTTCTEDDYNFYCCCSGSPCIPNSFCDPANPIVDCSDACLKVGYCPDTSGIVTEEPVSGNPLNLGTCGLGVGSTRTFICHCDD